jgi:hypothetical protein
LIEASRESYAHFIRGYYPCKQVHPILWPQRDASGLPPKRRPKSSWLKWLDIGERQPSHRLLLPHGFLGIDTVPILCQNVTKAGCNAEVKV